MKAHLDNSKDEHIEMAVSECKNLRAELVDLKLAFTKIAPKRVFNQPSDIIMTGFERKQKYDTHWFGPGFYTHVGGYKMCLNIDANGWDSGNGTHVSVYFYMMKGEFDSHLKWPFKGEITVELVNQKERGENYKTNLVEESDPVERDEYLKRVTEGERAEEGWGEPEFISHSDLYNPEEGKEYLVNDTHFQSHQRGSH